MNGTQGNFSTWMSGGGGVVSRRTVSSFDAVAAGPAHLVLNVVTCVVWRCCRGSFSNKSAVRGGAGRPETTEGADTPDKL